MGGYLIFFLLIIIVTVIGNVLREKGFDNLSILRTIDKDKVRIGEKFTVKTTILNEKKLPISFLYLKEEYPGTVFRLGEDQGSLVNGRNVYSSSFSIRGNECVKVYCDFVGSKRGVILLKNINATIGDFFGIESNNRDFDELQEVVVYPRSLDLKDISFNNNSIQGEYVIKRWIFKDPLYIKGIREYTRGDRMKDIHWNSSAKMGSLMVKEYDFTSEKELIFIVSTQCGDPYWKYLDENGVEKSVEVVATLAKSVINRGIPVGIETNSHILGIRGDEKDSVKASTKSLEDIYELLGRIDSTPKVDLSEVLFNIKKSFKREGIYVLVCPYLNNEAIGVINALVKIGVSMKIIDTSIDGKIPDIKGVEKIVYDGVRR